MFLGIIRFGNLLAVSMLNFRDVNDMKLFWQLLLPNSKSDSFKKSDCYIYIRKILLPQYFYVNIRVVVGKNNSNGATEGTSYEG